MGLGLGTAVPQNQKALLERQARLLEQELARIKQQLSGLAGGDPASK